MSFSFIASVKHTRRKIWEGVRKHFMDKEIFDEKGRECNSLILDKG